MPVAIPRDILEANAEMEREAVKDIAEAARWTDELRRIDPTLSVVWVPEEATNFDHPGRWHLRKQIPGTYDEWWPLLTESGGYRAPGSWLLDNLTASDMWNPRVHRSRKEAREKHRQAKLRARAREAEQRQDEMALAHRAANRIRGDAGLTKRTDLILPPAIAEEKKRKREAELAREKGLD